MTYQITLDKNYAGKCDLTGQPCKGALIIMLLNLPAIMAAMLQGRSRFFISYELLEPFCRQIIADIEK
ncbi:MAG: hypothetical protein V1933_07985 [Candidatus Omnitrophota bacterium]